MLSSFTPSEWWNAWHQHAELTTLAEGYATKRLGEWEPDDEELYRLIASSPDKALLTILAVMQLTDDDLILANLAAGPLEDFLGTHGEEYIGAIHALALEYPKLRRVLEGVWQGSMPKNVWRRVEVLKQSAFS